MTSPDQEQMFADLEGGPFLIGADKGLWGRADPPHPDWPWMIFWVAAAARPNGPNRFFFRLNCAGYPVQSPTGTLWDPESKALLRHALWPKGDAQVTAVFRTDYEGGLMLYHPYDRITMQKHPEWPAKYPHLLWRRDFTIANYLAEMHRLLTSSDYKGA